MWHKTDSLVLELPDDLKDFDSQSPFLKEKMLKEWFDGLKEHGTFRLYEASILHFALLLISFFKALSLLRCNEQFGQLVTLVFSCFKDVMVFNLFFMSWVFVFAKLFQIMGVEFDEEEYPLVPLLAFYLQTFRASLGESTPPQYNIWISM